MARTKERYDSAPEELKLLLDKKDEQKKGEVIAVIDACGMNYDEMIKLVRATSK